MLGSAVHCFRPEWQLHGLDISAEMLRWAATGAYAKLYQGTAYVTGTAGQGFVILVFRDGQITGIDITGGKYDGPYTLHEEDKQMENKRSGARGFLLAAGATLCLGLAIPMGQGCLAAVLDDVLADPTLEAVIAGPQRSIANIARDMYRHPLEVLTFFGVQPESSVVEIMPGKAGYWTEILAPYLKDHGHFTASGDSSRDITPLKERIALSPELYGKVVLTEFSGGDEEIAPKGSADFVLTFRNIHNWMWAGTAEAAFKAFYRALKPGGILGVEEHRGKADQPQDPQAKSGYVRQDYAIALAAMAGFKLISVSEINANPKDTKNYPEGVWTLPPTYRLGMQDREKYTAIGESDRFVLKFQKPFDAK
jgi:predicted methyltransferase